MKRLAIKMHEAWLSTLMAGFMSSGVNKQGFLTSLIYSSVTLHG